MESEFFFFVRSESDFISDSSNKLPELSSYFMKMFLVVFSAMFTSRNSFKNKWIHFLKFEDLCASASVIYSERISRRSRNNHLARMTVETLAAR